MNENPGCLSLFSGRKRKAASVKSLPINSEAVSIKSLPVEDETDAIPDHLPYVVSNKFLSPQEFSFYKLAYQTLNGKYTVCPKVSLAELFSVTETDFSQHQIYLNKIIRKRIDFLVCETSTMKPLYAIELDDSSHDQPVRQKRDQLVEAVFKAANLPLIRMQGKSAYTQEELIAQLLLPLQKGASSPVNNSPAQAAPENKPEPPHCSKCGAVMRQQTATSGPHTGVAYWVCSNYPTCKNFFQVDADLAAQR